MTYLRYMTLFSACLYNDDVWLVVRDKPMRPTVPWAENQDFQNEPTGKNWMDAARELPLTICKLKDVSPRIALMQAADVHTSDLLAYHLLATEGGTVADMDIVFLREVPKIDNDVQVVVFSGLPKSGYVPVSFMQGRPCIEWERALERAMLLYDPNVYESCGSVVLDPLKHISPLDERAVFPWVGMPFSSYRRWLFESEKYPAIPEQSCGIHWYAGHNQKFNQTIHGPDDLYQGAICDAAKEIAVCECRS